MIRSSLAALTHCINICPSLHRISASGMVTSGTNCRRSRNAIGEPVAHNGIYAMERAGIVTALFEKGIIISPQMICCSGEIVAPDRQKDVPKSRAFRLVLLLYPEGLGGPLH